MIKYFLKIYLIFISIFISGQINDSIQLREIYNFNLTESNSF